jgi:hypothetical protein
VVREESPLAGNERSTHAPIFEPSMFETARRRRPGGERGASIAREPRGAARLCWREGDRLTKDRIGHLRAMEKSNAPSTHRCARTGLRLPAQDGRVCAAQTQPATRAERSTGAGRVRPPPSLASPDAPARPTATWPRRQVWLAHRACPWGERVE